MGRVSRVDAGGVVYHAWNRANFRSALFKTATHYQDFLTIIEESLAIVPIRILAYCLMPNHWHMVLYPRTGPIRVSGTLSFVRRCSRMGSWVGSAE